MLILALDFNLTDALGASLLSMVISSARGFISGIEKFHHGMADNHRLRPGINDGGLVGAPASRKIKENTLTRIFALLLLNVLTGALLSVLI